MSRPRRFTGGDVLMKQLGVNPPVQLLWRLTGPLDPDAVKRVHGTLAGGPLNRRMTEARLPLARPMWTDRGQADMRPPRISSSAIAPAEVLDWADAACRTELDAHEGRGWELSAADVADGTSVVSLVGSHALTDGQGLISAVTLAARGVVPVRTLSRSSLRADVADIVTEGAKTRARLAIARLNNRFGQDPVAAVRGILTPARPIAGDVLPVRSRLAVTVATADLERVASARGGSTTGLVLAMTANVLRGARGAAEGPFTVGLPVSLRRPDDLESSNMVGIATVELESHVGRYTELAEIRRRCKAAYAGVGAGQHLTGYPRSDAALSNAGEMPEQTKDAFGPALGVLFRTVSGGGGSLGRMNCFVLRTGETVSVGYQSTGVAVGRDLVEAELDAWGVAATHWW